jgi:GNAT superfamily N-acetyltransferase
MIGHPLFARLEPWIEGYFGTSLSLLGSSPMPVAVRPDAPGSDPLLALKLGERAAVVVTDPDWPAKLSPVVERMHPDMVFSAFGCYELTRALSEEGIAVWGPNWHLFGDEPAVLAATDPVTDMVEAIPPPELAEVDFDLFWHCRPNSVAAFGVHEDGGLVALATVMDRGEPVLEIGMEVAPGAKGRGLGRAVVAAAARWIVESGSVALATVAGFNVPSARTLRSVGLEYLFMDLEGKRGPALVPPQTLGAPYPGAMVYDYYPRWAMNQDILPKPPYGAKT